MADNSKRTGAAIEAHYQFLLWLGPALENFPTTRDRTAPPGPHAAGDQTPDGLQLGASP